MLLDKDNNLWVATWGEGLFLYDRKTDNFVNFLANDPKSEFYSPIVLNITQSADGMIWVGTQKIGLLKLDPTTKTFKKVEIGNAKELSVMCALLDRTNKNKLWLSAGGHLLEFDSKSENYIDHTEVIKGLSSGFLGMVQGLI